MLTFSLSNLKSRSITTPLTVLSKPYVIAASAYILAISMMEEQTVHDSLRGLDSSAWSDAFLPQDGIKPSRGREDQMEVDIRGEHVDGLVPYARRDC